MLALLLLLLLLVAVLMLLGKQFFHDSVTVVVKSKNFRGTVFESPRKLVKKLNILAVFLFGLFAFLFAFLQF